jgi:CTP synthase
MKYIVVTGGVYSGLGKGVVSASIASLLAPHYKVINIKWDGYHNLNPGTMSPIEHGEVFVLDDGTEADLDLGHYERFTGVPCTGAQSITRGRLNDIVSQVEREGKRFEGKTIEEIPHLRDLLVETIERTAADRGADVVMLEVGGTVGDDSADLALHASRMLKKRHGEHNVMFVHVAPMCYTIDDHEPKTRPIQRSLSELSSFSIDADMLIVRTEAGTPLQDEQRRKISEASALRKEDIFEARSLKTVYALPREFVAQGLDKVLAERLLIPVPPITPLWLERVANIEHPKDNIDIGLCGKYTTVHDSYKSIVEALTHAGAALGLKVGVHLVSTERRDLEEHLAKYDGIIVPGGYGTRGIEGKIRTIQYAREHSVPFLGLCYGMQLAVVEYARNVCGLVGAHTTEVDAGTPHPVVTILPEQVTVTMRSGTQRLGAQEALLAEGSLAHKLYGSTRISERHRHRYEINPDYLDMLATHGLVVSGVHAKREEIIEFVELPQDVHPFFIATQAHPELKSAFLNPARLFQGLVDAAYARRSAQHNL